MCLKSPFSFNSELNWNMSVILSSDILDWDDFKALYESI